MKLVQSRWEGNEIVATLDANRNADSLLLNLDVVTNIIEVQGGASSDIIMTGMVVSQATVPNMTVQISAGIAKDVQSNGETLTGELFENVSVASSDPSQNRRDTVEARRLVEDTTPENRQFKNPITEEITTSSIFTQTDYKTEVQVLAGSPGGNAPSHTTGWVKIAEILVPAASTTVINANIYNCDAEGNGLTNTNWTTEVSATYRNGTLREMKDVILQNETDIATLQSNLNTETALRKAGDLGVDNTVVQATSATQVTVLAGGTIDVNGLLVTVPNTVLTLASANTDYYIFLNAGVPTITSTVPTVDSVKNALFTGGNRVLNWKLRRDATQVYISRINDLYQLSGTLRIGLNGDALINSPLGIQRTPDSGYSLDVGGRLKVETGSAGTWTPSTSADEGVFESASNGGISIGTPDANLGVIYFGSPSDSVGAGLEWSYNSKLFNVGTATTGGILRLMTNNFVEAIRISSDQNIVHNGRFFFWDNSFNDYRIQGSTSDGADNSRLLLGGGGSISDTRGGYIEITGNEQTSTGDIAYIAGAPIGEHRFNTNSLQRLKISFGGSIGINEPTPSGLLDLNVDGFPATFGASKYGHFQFADRAGGVELSPTIYGISNDTIGLSLISGTNNSATVDFDFDIRENDNSEFVTQTGAGFTWSRFGTELMRLTRAGLLGLNQNAPTHPVHIQSTINFMRFQESDGTVNKRNYDIVGVTDELRIRAKDDTNSFVRDLITMQHDGNIGIGLQAAAQKLNVSGNISMYDTTNVDRSLIFASDASILWDESANYFSSTKSWAFPNQGDSEKYITGIIPLGDWNMDATSTLIFSAADLNMEGLTVLSQIRSVYVVIRQDSDVPGGPEVFPFTIDLGPGIRIRWRDSTDQIALSRSSGGVFDSANYDQTSYNRGWMHIEYSLS